MEEKKPKVQMRIRKVKQDEIVLDFCRNELNKRSFHYSKEHGYYIAESARLGNLKVNYLIKIKKNNIEKYLNKKYPDKLRINGNAEGFRFKFTSVNIFIYDYTRRPDVDLKREVSYKSDELVLKYLITGNYYDQKRIKRDKQRKGFHFRSIHGSIKSSATPYITSGWSSIHPYSGGGFSPR